MKIRDEAIKQINSLQTDELLYVLNFINSYKKELKVPVHRQFKSYKKIRSILSKSSTSLSEDIIDHREDRI